jgi:hypothetical protein
MTGPENYKLIYLARRAKTVSREDWPRTWRSHAIFASQFPVLEAEIDWLRYCNRVDQPSLGGRPVELPELSTAHDGVAVAASASFESITGGGFSAADQARIDEDERRVFDMLTPHFTFFNTETVLKDGPLGQAALFRFLPRGEGLDRDAFTARYREGHAAAARPVVRAIPGLVRAALNHPVNDPRPLFPFDGISEYWFATAEDAVSALSEGRFDAVSRDLEAFCDLDRSVLMLTSVCHRWSDP